MGIVVTKTGNIIKVNFNEYTSAAETRKANFNHNTILSAQIKNYNNGGEYIEVHVESTENIWKVSTDGFNDTFVVDTINEVSPTDLDHLLELITSLMP